MTVAAASSGAVAVEFRKSGAISDSESVTTDDEAQRSDKHDIPRSKHDKDNTRSSATTAAPVLPRSTLEPRAQSGQATPLLSGHKSPRASGELLKTPAQVGERQQQHTSPSTESRRAVRGVLSSKHTLSQLQDIRGEQHR